MKLYRIGFGTPLDEGILLYWEDTGHIEGGELWIHSDMLGHTLDNGESLMTEPSHWYYLPEVSD